MVYSLLCSLIFIFGHKLGIFLYLYGVDRKFVSTVWRSVVAVAPETPQNTAWSSFDSPATTFQFQKQMHQKWCESPSTCWPNEIIGAFLRTILFDAFSAFVP